MLKIFLASICFIAVGTSAYVAHSYIETMRHDFPTKITYRNLTEPSKKQIDCLAENIYFESAFEPKSGQVAVALVTLNRLHSGNYASDICGVVYQKVRGTCQFSWVCDKTIADKRLTVRDTKVYNDVRNLALSIVLNYSRIPDPTNGATFYHADYVNPRWKLPQTIKIGTHIFYRNDRDVNSIKKENLI